MLVAAFAEKIIAELIVNNEPLKYIAWAAFEEIIKFSVFIAIAYHAKSYDEPVDAMVYCITVALGFAALENTLFIMGPLSQGDLAQGILTGNMRFLGATLVHTVSSGMIGFTLGLTFYKKHIETIIVSLVGLSAAVALHAAFNLSIISVGTGNAMQTFAWVWGMVVIMIVFFEEVKAVHPPGSVVPQINSNNIINK